MALRWDFKYKGGTVTQEHGGTHNWYEGNGLMIVLNEWEENGKEYYSMYWFFVDKDHMKNSLGMNKKQGYTDNIFADDPITEIVISRENCYRWKDLVTILPKAFPDIKITLTK